ncbi:MAG: DUF5665 domain-containing protein [Oscillospiraceae bacterium]|nr:DUF5665 domain-containing protein [Oscillospiraceae bacterium]
MSKKLDEKIDKLNKILERTNLIDLIYIVGRKREIFKRNILAGIARGIGFTIGVTIVTAVVIYILQSLVTLNIPLIGEYIVEIIDVIERGRP